MAKTVKSAQHVEQEPLNPNQEILNALNANLEHFLTKPSIQRAFHVFTENMLVNTDQHTV